MISRYDFIRPKIYPLFMIAISFAAGIWWQSYAYPFALTCILCLSFIVLSLSYSWYWNKTNIIILSILASTTFAGGAIRYQLLINKQKAFQESTGNKKYTVKGTIIDYRKTGKPRPSHRLILHLNQLENSHEKIVVDVPLLIYCQRIKGISIANTIMIHDITFKHNYSAEFNRYLLKEGTLGSLFLQHQQIQKIWRPRFSFARWLFYFRKNLAARCKAKMEPGTYLYFSSIFLGDPETKKMIDPVKAQLQRWGLVHYLARAGLHVVIFIALWQFLLRLIPLRFVIKELILILLCCLYALLSWPSIPFQRAFLSFIITRSCILMRLKVYYIPVLMMIMVATLIGNPIYLFSLDFQLSFGVTFALAWFNEIQARYYS